MAKVTIGNTTYEVPELNFIALERAWPFIEQSMVTVDPMIGPSSAIRVIAAGLMEAPGFSVENFGWTPPTEFSEETTELEVKLAQLPPDDEQIFEIVTFFLKKQLKATQIVSVAEALNEITKEAGLVAVEGEGLAPAKEMTPSPETAINTSLSS